MTLPRRLLGLLPILSLWIAAPPQAATLGESLGGSVGVSSDQVFRGLSQNGANWAVQGDLHVAGAAGWFVGVWAAAADKESGYYGSTEINPYAGYYRPLGNDWSLRTTYVRYVYPSGRRYLDYDYDELSGSLTYTDRVSLSVGWSPNFTQNSLAGAAEDRRSLAYELTAGQPLWRSLSLNASAGLYDLRDLYDETYWAWSGGLKWRHKSWDVSLIWLGVDADGRRLFGDRARHGKVVFGAHWRF